MEEESESDDKVNNNNKNKHLPHDLITQHILTRLPIKSLLSFKSVSKQWYSTLSSSHFALTHFKLSPFSPPHFLFIENKNNYYLLSLTHHHDAKWLSLTRDSDLFCFANNAHQKLVTNFNDDGLVLIGSCNGLVCLASFNANYFILWNPFTGKFSKYLDFDNVFSNFRVSWGFGYVSFSDDFKVVRVIECPDTSEIFVHVFSLKSNKWTRISDEVYQGVFSLRTRKLEVSDIDDDDGGGGDEGVFSISYLFQSRQGVLVDETLCWIVFDRDVWGRKIVAFDLVRETFDTIEDLELVYNDVYRDRFLCVVGGCLSKCGVNLRDDVVIRVLEGPKEVEAIRLWRDLGLRSCESVVGFRGASELFVLLEGSTISCIDPKSEPLKYTPLVIFENAGKTRVASFIPSLFSPNAIG